MPFDPSFDFPIALDMQIFGSGTMKGKVEFYFRWCRKLNRWPGIQQEALVGLLPRFAEVKAHRQFGLDQRRAVLIFCSSSRMRSSDINCLGNSSHESLKERNAARVSQKDPIIYLEDLSKRAV